MTSRDTRVKILVIDDNQPNLLAMKALLEPLGHEVLLADGAERGLAIASAQEIALIIADVRMPEIDGLKMLARLRAGAGANPAPVVFISGYAYDSDEARRAFALGALDYILRPIDPDILRAKIQALVTLTQQAREIEQRKETIREKDRYIGMLGHDLRNPLSAIKLGLDAFIRSASLSEKDRYRLARLSATAARMQEMIHDLLDYTRSAVGGLPLRPVRTDLGRLCHTIVEEVGSLHPDRRIRVNAEGDLSGVWDADRLLQALANLIGNAIEHGGGDVIINIEPTEREVVLSVRNDGEPIAPGLLPRLFEPFHRGDANRRGLGLGLYIVREIVRGHGGTIEVRSSAPEGTIFIAHWPRQPAAINDAIVFAGDSPTSQ
jgi:signal transduction histidine kinase